MQALLSSPSQEVCPRQTCVRPTNRKESERCTLSLLEGNQRLRVCRHSCRALLRRSVQDRHAYDQQIGKSRRRCTIRALSLLEGNRRLRVCRRSCRALLTRSAQDRHAYDQQTGKSRRITRFVRCRCLKEIGDSVCAGALAEPSSRGLPKTGMRTTNKSERVGALHAVAA